MNNNVNEIVESSLNDIMGRIASIYDRDSEELWKFVAHSWMDEYHPDED